MQSRIRGRVVGSVCYDEQVAGLYALAQAMVRLSRRDIEQVMKLGEQATAQQQQARREAERFIQEMRQWAR